MIDHTWTREDLYAVPLWPRYLNQVEQRYAVRPVGQVGACGWHPVPWAVVCVHADSEAMACAFALWRLNKGRLA
jgi:hypothetical protein